MATLSGEELAIQLRAMLAGRGDGIDLDTPFHWVIKDLKQPVPFFEHLPDILPPDSILYAEGTSIAADIAAFYSSHRARNAVDVKRDTIVPVPDVYHFRFSPEVSSAMRMFAANRPIAEMFDHIKAYQGKSLLLTFHDAFDGELRLSDHLSEDSVARFCRTLGASCRRAKTKRRDPEKLRRLLLALEGPNKMKSRVRIQHWLGKIWRRWTGGDH